MGVGERGLTGQPSPKVQCVCAPGTWQRLCRVKWHLGLPSCASPAGLRLMGTAQQFASLKGVGEIQHSVVISTRI